MQPPPPRTATCIRTAPAALKLGACLALIFGVGALPVRYAWWGLGALPVLLLLAWLAGLPLSALLRRLTVAAPFLLGFVLLALVQRRGSILASGLLIKASVSLLALQILTQICGFSELLRALRRARVPDVLCRTLGLLYRYSFVLIDESRRLSRARASRTLRGSRLRSWGALAHSLGMLFVRTVSRAERVEAAYRGRGGV